MHESNFDEWQAIQALGDPVKRILAQQDKEQSGDVHPHSDPRQDAARKRLRESRDHLDACEAIREIVSNLMGCEEMALVRLDRASGRASLIWSFGIDPEAFRLPVEFHKSALPALIVGEACIEENSGEAAGAPVTAFVPIQFKGATAAVLILFKLLPQKSRIEAPDRALFAVLSREAGKPLFGGPASDERNR